MPICLRCSKRKLIVAHGLCAECLREEEAEDN